MPASTILRAASSGNSGSSATSNSQITVTAPAGVVSGDKLALIITIRTAMASTWVAPSGWTLVNNPNLQGSGGGYVYTATYGTDVTGTSWTFNPSDTSTANKWSWSCVALNGSTVGAIQTSAWGGQGTASTTLNLGPISPTGSAYLVALAGDRANGTTWTWGSGWVEETDTASTGTNSCSATIAIDDTTPVAAGSYSTTATGTNSTANSWWGMVAYSPAGGGGGTAATATGTVTLGGTVSAKAPAAATGAITLTGTASATAPATATGSLTLGGTATPSGGPVAATATGGITLGGAAAAKASATATGTLTLGGTVTAKAAATASGGITLGGSAGGQGPLRDITLTYGPVTASRIIPGDATALTITAAVTTRTVTADPQE